MILYHSCISSDLERVREGLGDKVSFIFQFLAQFIAGFTIGFVYGWKLALVMMSLTPLLAVCGAFLSKVRLDYILSTSNFVPQFGKVVCSLDVCNIFSALPKGLGLHIGTDS